jgi:site-specific recombinase XerD
MDSSGRRITFLDLVRERIRLRHLSYTTEKSYIGWIRRFIVFHGKKHPQEMEEEHIVAFLSDLAVQRNCSPATQNQAINVLVFLFRHVLNRNIGEFKGIMWARRKQRIA